MRVQLDEALADATCTRERPKPVPALAPGAAVIERTTTEPLSVRAGSWATFDVAVRSATGAPLTLMLEPPSGAEGWGLGELGSIDASALEGAGRLGGTGYGVGGRKPGGPSKPTRPVAPPTPAPRATSGFHVTTADARGRPVDRPAGVAVFGVLGLGVDLDRQVVRVDLASSGAAIARVRWQAVGYDPDRPPKAPAGADPDEGFALPDPAPLKPGTYRLFVWAPIAGGELASSAIEITVSR